MRLKKKIKTVLICGATGFIGRNAVEFFAKDSHYQVIALHHKNPPFQTENVKWIRIDLLNSLEVKTVMKDVDIVIQAAAVTTGINQVFVSPEIHVTNNAIMNSIIFREAYLNKIKHLIFFSCTTMLQNSDIPASENDFDPNKEMFYKYFGSGWTKVYLEKMCEFFSRLGATKFTVIRHSNVYGPWDKFDLLNSHVFGATISKVMSNSKTIEIWGNGNERRDLLYITDLIEMIRLIVEKQYSNFEIFNCGGKEYVSINELVAKICKIAGKHLTIEHNREKPNVDFSVRLDSSKAKLKLGWTQETDLDTGIQNTINFWKQSSSNFM